MYPRSASTPPLTMASWQSRQLKAAPQHAAPPRKPRPRVGARWVQRMFYRYQPVAILVFFACLVGVPLILDLFVGPVRDWIDGQAGEHEVGVNLLEHVLVAALVAAAAFYSVLGRKRQRALRAYRDVARKRAGDLVDWWQGHKTLTRRAMSDLLADGIDRSREPALAVVHGRAGTGRTSFVMGLIEDLAERNLIPIPVRACRDGSLSLDDEARVKFCRHVDRVLSSDREADEIWHRARSTRDVVILVDGLDDELVGTLWRDGNKGRLDKAITELHEARISVVLASTKELPLGEHRQPLREDLDMFSREEAERHVEQELRNPTDTVAVVEALGLLSDPVDGFRITPIYLDLLVRLWKAGVCIADLPKHRDCCRAAVIGTYLANIDSGEIRPSVDTAGVDAPDDRGHNAVLAAQEVARHFDSAGADLAVALDDVELPSRALADAVDLNLLWHGDAHVGFAADDIGAFLLAATLENPDQLLDDVARIAESEQSSPRGDRHLLTALIFWHLRRDKDEAREGLRALLAAIEEGDWTRPAVVAAAVRIASARELVEDRERIRNAADRCIDSLEAETRAGEQTWRATELTRLVRALAEWPCPQGHELLWRLATNRDIEVEWPAAKALAMAKGEPWSALAPIAERSLARATAASADDLSRPEDDRGNEIRSLAWILPALRDSDPEVGDRLATVARLCLAKEMSPLRGEMALAQGLKLAVLKGRAPDDNIADVRKLLFARARPLRFWHARLVLVQAVLAHAWQHTRDADALDAELEVLQTRERHPLARGAIDLARQGLRDVRRAKKDRYPLSRYMWSHERDAVRWVEQGKAEVAQLAADTVLLSNMTYRLRRNDGAALADAAAASSRLPQCMRTPADREHMTRACTCPQGLCGDASNEPAVRDPRARFTESFCREQARLAVEPGPPAWRRSVLPAYRGRRRLEAFWDRQAELARNGGSASHPG
jgi:hypothetical protein